MDVVPRSTASRNGPASGLMSIRFRFSDGGGGNSTTIPATGGMAAGQPPAAAHGLRAEDGAIRVARLGRPFKKPYPARPAAPEPRTQRGRGQFAGQPDRLGKRLPRFHRKDVVEAG